MNRIFDYSTDTETVTDCLGIIACAADRVARGQPAFLGGARSAAKSKNPRRTRNCAKANAKSTAIPEHVRARIIQLLKRGMKTSEVARQTGSTYGRVYFVRDCEGLRNWREAA